MISDKPMITFDKSAKMVILSWFGITIDQEGYLVEADNPTMRITTPKGEQIREDEFAGIRKGDTEGSFVLIKSDLCSLIELVDRLDSQL